MRDLIRQLSAAIHNGRDVAYCRLVETRGSTPQKAGALMLVYADGSQAGTLGGGCVEAEVKRRALAALAMRQAEIAKFQLDSDYGWDDGLICGGRMQVLIVPLVAGRDASFFLRMAELIEHGRGLTEVVVYDVESADGAAPTSFLLDDRDELVATANWSSAATATDRVPSVVKENLRPLSSRPRPYGAKGMAYLPTTPRCRLLIVGGGHVGKAVADLAADLEFDVWVVDDRADIVSSERFPRAERRIAGDIESILPGLEVTPDTYCLIVTRGHNHDEEALFHLVDRGARYVGLIGSRRKIKMIFDDLLAEGISSEALARVFAPLGIDIGSQTVPEIAVSICAELIAHRNRQGFVPGRPASVPAAV